YGPFDDFMSNDGGWYSSDSSSDVNSEVSVYDGKFFAYFKGYGFNSADMEAIFGAPTDASSGPDMTFDFAGGMPSFSGTSFFSSLLISGKGNSNGTVAVNARLGGSGAGTSPGQVMDVPSK